jgi:drug/metabolite transporter (DMT)-like permease
MTAAPRNTAVKGMAFAAIAVTIFAVQDGISKHLAEQYPSAFIVTIRYWAFAVFVVLFSMRRRGGLLEVARTSRPILQFCRGALLALETILAIAAFAAAGLAATHAVFASAPLMVAALSMPILGEHVGWRRWAAIGVGFVGMLLILRPGVGVFDPALMLAVVAVIGFAFYGVMTRLASRTDRSSTSFFWTGIGGAAVMTVIVPFYWPTMTGVDWLWMGALCVTGTVGHFLLIKGYEYADAVLIQPLSYIQMVLATMIGVFVFSESLAISTVVGAALIVGAGVFTAWREHVVSRRSARQSVAGLETTAG